MYRITFILLMIALSLIITAGCSKSMSNPAIPGNDNNPLNLPIVTNPGDDSPHQLLGVWTIEFDIENMTATITPYRESDVHYNIMPYVPFPSIVVNSWNPTTNILDVNVTINNPTAISVYDTRLITFTDAIGHKLMNDDSWTDLYDIAGGLPVNPFKAFGKSIALRKFAAQSQLMENCKFYMPYGNWNVQIAIDASFPANCSEPYELNGFTQGLLVDNSGASCQLDVNVLDWQNDVSSVVLYCPVITGGPVVSFTNMGSNHWNTTLYNTTGQLSGFYTGYLVAWSTGSGSQAIYKEVTINVTPRDWARTWGGTGVDQANDVAADGSGAIYVVGNFDSVVDFDPGPNQDFHTGYGGGDAYLAKYDRAGNLQWAKTWGGNGWDEAREVCVDNYGNIYVTGDYSLTVDFDPRASDDWHSSNGGQDAFVVRYASDGTFNWAKTWGGNGTYGDAGWGVATNAASVFISGIFDGTVDFDPSGGTTQYTKTTGGSAAFLSAFASDGTFQWVKAWCTENDPAVRGDGTDIITDGNTTGYVYVIGSWTGTVDFDPDGGIIQYTCTSPTADLYLTKFSYNGFFHWTRVWDAQPRGITYDIAGGSSLYVTGWFENTVDFNPSTGTDNRTSNGNWDVFFSKFDSSGNYKWVRAWGGVNGDWAEAIDIDKFTGQNLYLTGLYEGGMDFDPSPGTHYVSGYGAKDVFVTKFDSNGNHVWAKGFGGLSDDRAYGIAVDNILNVMNAGYFNGQADFDAGAGVDARTSNGLSDAFLKRTDFQP
jgi:hypothetical protein